MFKIANNIQGMLLKQAKRLKAEDITFGDSDYPGHVAADYLYGMTGLPSVAGHAMMRSNVSQVLAEAAGIPSKDISWTVKYPSMSMIAGVLGGGGVGAAAGLGVGSAFGDDKLGLLIGGIGGGLGGGLLTTLSRRKAMKEIAEKFDTAKQLKKLKPENLGYFASVGKALSNPVHPTVRDMLINTTAGFTRKA